MTSERRFANGYGSFWRELLPIGERVLRSANLQAERFAPPLAAGSPPEHRAVINEAGFRIFCEHWGASLRVSTPPKSGVVRRIVDETAEYVGRLAAASGSAASELSATELGEALELAGRLRKFFVGKGVSAVACSPEFAGCGWLDYCEGDVFANGTLFEVKSGERTFRLADIRQVLTYCALNYAQPRYPIDSVCLVNPRHGVFVETSLEVLCERSAGMGAAEVLAAIIDFIAEPNASI